MRAIQVVCLALLWAGAPVLAQEPPDPTPAETPPPAPEEPAEGTPEEGPPAEAEPAPAVASEGVPFYPLQVGRAWTYRVTFKIVPVEAGADPGEAADTEKHRLDVYVAPSQTIDGQPVSAVEWKLDQELSQRAYFCVSEGYLRCVKRLQGMGEHTKEFTLTPPQPVLPESPAVGETWTWTGKVGGDTGTQRYALLREETVETPAGTFQALVLQSEFVGEDDSRGKTTRWLVDGVGMVKEISEVRTASQIFRTEGVLVRHELADEAEPGGE